VKACSELLQKLSPWPAGRPFAKESFPLHEKHCAVRRSSGMVAEKFAFRSPMQKVGRIRQMVRVNE